MVRKLEIVGLGAMNLDQLYLVERAVLDGEAEVLSTQQAPGGSAANTIYALGKLGVGAGFAGAVGGDGNGRLLLKDLTEAGVDVSRIRVKDGPTGVALGITDRRGKRALYLSPGANDLLEPADIDARYINRARFLHISSFAGERQLGLTRELVARLSPAVSLSFSPGMLYATIGMDAVATIIARAAVLFLNRAELQLLTGKDLIEGAETLHRAGCRQVVVTLGKGMKAGRLEGQRYGQATAACYVSDGDKGYAVEATKLPDLPLVDSTGAGDAFAAGFLYGLLRGRGTEACGRLGHLLARFSMSRAGARAGLPVHATLDDMFRQTFDLSL